MCTIYENGKKLLQMAFGCLATLLLTVEWAQSGEIEFDLRTETARARTVQALSARAGASRQAAIDMARDRGWPVRGKTMDGRVFELIRIENHRPYYMVTMNAEAAISTAVDLVRGVMPYNASGQDVVVGVWDGGAVRVSHQEFGGRAIVMDGTMTVIDHATHVAGTVGATGEVAKAKGMTPAAMIHSYDWNDDLAETTGAAATGANEPDDIYISNHSYGQMTGWAYGNWSGASGWHWFGESLSDREDRNFGRYSSVAQDWDELAFNASYYLSVWAAGNDRSDTAPSAGTTFYYYDNSGPPPQRGWKSKTYDPDTDPYDDGWKDGGYDTLADAAVAKNTLTVGAVNDAVTDGERDLDKATMTTFSAWGPTDDGRVKPDVVANGVSLYSAGSGNDEYYSWKSGTSMAAPNAAGSAALLIDVHRSLFEKQNMRAATLKGLIVHTADTLGKTGPDYRFGWGLMNTRAAAEQILLQADHTNAPFAVESVLSSSTTNNYTFHWNGTDPIRVTLSWTDPEGSVKSELNNTNSVLINDLDLRLLAPDEATFFSPYVLDPANPTNAATTGDNTLDNVEQVFLAEPPKQGEYVVEISHKGSLAYDEQAYSLMVNGQAPLGPAIVKLHDLEQIYDNTARHVTVTTDPSGLQVETTYDGETTAPVQPGEYSVHAIVTDPLYAGEASGILTVHPVVQAEAGPNGIIEPSGEVVVPYGGSTNFLIEANLYWGIEALLHDDDPVEAAAGAILYTSQWSSVVAPHTVSVSFAAMTTTNDVPHWWLAEHGWSNNWDEVTLTDPDNDGFKVWQEYIADTDPNDGTDFFPPLTLVDGSSTLELGIDPTSTQRVYHVYWTTNLIEIAWKPLTNAPGTGADWTVEVPEGKLGAPVFFRSFVTVP